MENVQKIGFFKRIKMSIFDLEKYSVFLNEKVFVAFKYLLKLLLILVAVFSISTTVQLTKQIDTLLNYVKQEFPEFEYKEGTLSVNEIVNAYDKEYDAKLIVDTGEVSTEKLEEYNMKAEENTTSAVMLKDKAVVRANGVMAEISYKDFFETMGITTLNKSNVVNKYNEKGFLFQIGVAIYFYSFMVLYVQYFLVVLENILIVALFGWIASKIVGAKLKFSKAFIVAIYGLTLSSILNIIYSIVASFTTFEIKYFGLMYLIIGYIYMMAIILINKADIIENSKKEEKATENNENLEVLVQETKKDNKDTKNEDNKE